MCFYQLRSLEVGSEFPSITNLRLLSGELEEDGARLRSLDLNFDLTYDGNFRIDVDAVMLLGKIANISITGNFQYLYISCIALPYLACWRECTSSFNPKDVGLKAGRAPIIFFYSIKCKFALYVLSKFI